MWAVLRQDDDRLRSLKVPKAEGREIQSLPLTWEPAEDYTASIILHSLQVKEKGEESEDREKAVEKDEKKTKIMKIIAGRTCAIFVIYLHLSPWQKREKNKERENKIGED